MLQLVQRFRLSALFFVVGIVLISLGIYKLKIDQNNPQPVKIVKAETEQTEIYQSTNKTIEIHQNESESASTSASIMVDVSGAVTNPGVYRLPIDARISQAVESAGGISKKGDLPWIAKNLNLATKLSDGDKIFIPAQGEIKPTQAIEERITSIPLSTPQIAGVTTEQLGLQKPVNTPLERTSPTASPGDGKVNVNKATASELDVLPGVGPVTAQKIITGRPYQTLEELKEKKAVNKSTFEKIKDKIKL